MCEKLQSWRRSSEEDRQKGSALTLGKTRISLIIYFQYLPLNSTKCVFQIMCVCGERGVHLGLQYRRSGAFHHVWKNSD